MCWFHDALHTFKAPQHQRQRHGIIKLGVIVGSLFFPLNEKVATLKKTAILKEGWERLNDHSNTGSVKRDKKKLNQLVQTPRGAENTENRLGDVR